MTNGADTAFPAWEMGGQGPEPTSFGLTKREMFAAMAMQGLLASTRGFTFNVYAKEAVKLADELVSELGSWSKEYR